MSVQEPIFQITAVNVEAVKPAPDGGQELRAEKLLHNITIEAQRGEIVLLLGSSGSGKSLLTNLLLGFLTPFDKTLLISCTAPDSRFCLRLDGREIDILANIYPAELEGKIGVMFQSLGLFDDLDVEENMAFANDQAEVPRYGHEWKVWRKEIVGTLGLPPNILSCQLDNLSGGQKQRVAFGRFLAFRPRIMIFDEPTSALDLRSTQQAVALIKKTHTENDNLLSIVITHDYENFLEIADRVWFINQRQEIENDCPPKTAEYYQDDLARPRKPSIREVTAAEILQHQVRCDDWRWNSAFPRFFRTLRKIFRWQSYLWFAKFFWVMVKLLVIRSLPYNVLTGFFLGLVATYFSLHLELGNFELSGGGAVQIKNFVVPAFFREMLSGFGVVMFRALIPLFTCIFIAARSGTAITAYFTNMKDSERRQWDAMRNFGVEPSLFFYPQILVCFVFGCWILSYISFLVSALGSLVVALATNPLCTWYTWVDTFWVHLEPKIFLGFIPIFEGFAMFTVKTMCAGVAIASISFWWGTKPRKSSMDILKHLIGANICNMVAILLIFFVLLIMELG